MVTVKQVEDDNLVSKGAIPQQLKCPRFCFRDVRIPLYRFSSQSLLDDSPFEEHVCITEDEQSALDSLLLAQWEDKMWKGILRYDVTTSEIKVIFGRRKFIAQLNERLGMDYVPKPEPDKICGQGNLSEFQWTKHQEEFLFYVASGEMAIPELIPSAAMPDGAVLIIINEIPVEYGPNTHSLSLSLGSASTRALMEIDNPPSSDKANETDDDFAIVLELSEDDLHFDKKKKLLQNKGFNPKEQVYLKSSTGPDWISTILKVMLQIARIIQLDEGFIGMQVELYFGEDDACSSVEYYSPRNEVEALNSILSLLDISLSSGMCMQMNVLQELREAIIGMIRDFGDKNCVKTTILENHSCGKEECLLQWGENNGIRTRLQIAYVEGAGRGAIARENLNVGDIAVEIPVSTVISEELIRESKMFHILEKIDGISSETILLLWSMKEKHNCNSKFKIYFNTLPEEFNTGLSFGIEAIMALDGTMLLEEIVQAKQHLQTQYDSLFPTLFNDHPDIFPREVYTREQFLWACELWYSNSMQVMFPDGKLRTCLIPIAGFLNHSIYPHILHYGKVDPATNSLKFCLSRPCSQGEQCFLSYGNFSSSHLLTFYGFLPQGDNPYDVIPMEFEAEQEDCMEGNPRLDWTTHMVQGTWLSNNHNIFYYGLPPPLLDYLRRAKNPMLQTKSLLQSNLENEMEVLGDLLSTFDGMMENLGETDLNDRENASWDVRLAEEFKDQQRRIVSSVLTSCHKGLRLVKNELRKCMNEDTRG